MDTAAGFLSWSASSLIDVSTTGVLLLITSLMGAVFLYRKLRFQESWEDYGVKHANVGLVMELAAMAQAALRHGETVGVSREQLFLITRDLDLLKQILVKDFNVFANRQDKLLTRTPISNAVFFLRDARWKRVRQLMSPSFSTRKLKRISIFINESAQKMAQAAHEIAVSGKPLKVRHLAGQYATSIIARIAFGLHSDCIGEAEDDQFTHCAKNMFRRRGKVGRSILIFCAVFSFLYRFFFWLKIPFFEPVNLDTCKYLVSVLTDAVRLREQAEAEGNSHVYSDFLQSLVSAKPGSHETRLNNDSVENESLPTGSNDSNNFMTMHDIMGQSMLIILAGFETTSTSIQFCLYFLAQNPEIQDQVYSEIKREVESESPTREELSRLAYMDQVINETLRLYPPAAIVTRQAMETRTYDSVTIPAGAAVVVPIREIHRDPHNYPDPEKFDPDRFSPERRAARHSLAFMPFGWGPRVCIGQRLAYLEIKTCLVHFLRKVKVEELNECTVPRKGQDLVVPLKTLPLPTTPVELFVSPRL